MSAILQFNLFSADLLPIIPPDIRYRLSLFAADGNQFDFKTRFHFALERAAVWTPIY
jgi:hypothetical protein